MAKKKTLTSAETTASEASVAPDASASADELKRRYPAMLYRVRQRSPLVLEHQPVTSAAQQAAYEADGWVAGGPGEAVAAFDKGAA